MSIIKVSLHHFSTLPEEEEEVTLVSPLHLLDHLLPTPNIINLSIPLTSHSRSTEEEEEIPRDLPLITTTLSAGPILKLSLFPLHKTVQTRTVSFPDYLFPDLRTMEEVPDTHQ